MTATGLRSFFRTLQTSKESDEETWESDEESEKSEEVSTFDDIKKEYEVKQQALAEYVKSKTTDCNLITNPWMQFLDEEIFVVLIDVLEKMLHKAIETNSLKYHKSTFNPMDFIVEYLWNLNPKHPERRDTWVSLFDMDWVKEILKNKPRPYFPFSWIWSKDYAALKIQAFMRGYWVRRREEVQEMRQFWKALDEDRLEAKEMEDARPLECECKKDKEEARCYKT